MSETQSLVGRLLRSDTVMYAGPSENTRDYADKMLLAALQEAQSVVRYQGADCRRWLHSRTERPGALPEPDARGEGTACENVYYVDPDAFENLRDLVHQALKSDWTSVLAAELLKTSRVRTIKQARFRHGLMMTVVSFVVLGCEQRVRSLAVA